MPSTRRTDVTKIRCPFYKRKKDSMKKLLHPFAVPAIVWGIGLGMALTFCGCGKSREAGRKNAVSPILSPPETLSPTQQADSVSGVLSSSIADSGEAFPEDSSQEAVTSTPEPAKTPVPTPAAVNTDTSSVTFLVNREYPLPENYVPEELMTPDVLFPFSDTSIDKAKMTPEAGEALTRLFHAAYDEAGLTLYGISAYRSYARQYTIYATNLAVYGTAHANRYSAAPGKSEHQTGLAIDISCASEGFSLEESFADTPEGIWVAENAHRFGFILRYPKEKEDITGYSYEPWHIRYVGTELATLLYKAGLTLEEYYGVSSALTAEYLDITPLIDTTVESYLSIYRQYHPATN